MFTKMGNQKQVAILFYRAHYLAGNTKPIDALCHALIERNLSPLPIFVSSLKDSEIQIELLSLLKDSQIILNTTSFSLANLGDDDITDFWQQLNLPILQVIFSSSTEDQWNSSFQGLTPRDVAINVALPEVDGRIITRAVSFKSVEKWHNSLQTDVIIYQENQDRINFIADLTANYIKLKNTPKNERKIALILANYPNKNARLANGVGLDTPASCLNILKALKNDGYLVENIPANGEELINILTAGITNDLEFNNNRNYQHYLSLQDLQNYYHKLPEKIKRQIEQRWGKYPWPEKIPIPGIQLGNIFVGIQPSRGYELDSSLNYHAPDLEPTPNYLAYYYWLKHIFKTHAFIHLGKHGNLEWLPGKSTALSDHCYPEIALGPFPNFYPFIVNDPGEGSQAKRRSQAVIVDHLTPPLTRAELYGNLQAMEGLIDEYYEAQSLNPTRLKNIGDRLLNLIQTTQLNQDLGIETISQENLREFLTVVDGHLCEIKEAQIRDGLHIFGQLPQDRQLRDLIIAIARQPDRNRVGLTRAIATHFGLDVNPLIAEKTEPLTGKDFPVKTVFSECKNVGDAIEILENIAIEIVENILNQEETTNNQEKYHPDLEKEINWIRQILLPKLKQTNQEISNLLIGLNGKFVPSGPSGAPTRGRPDVLPTGRNFYSVDIRAIPTETAWDVGRKAAEGVIERYTQENGDYPRNLAISVWGTSTMRTGGDDIAQVLALLGVQPVWDGTSRRVIDFEILPISVLGRPRVDVTLRISGFFRDSFPNLIDLVHQAITAVSELNESPDDNPLASQVQKEAEFWQQQGVDIQQAREQSQYRIFGSKPGAYGAGLQGLMEAQNWENEQDLAQAYINWSSYAYNGKKEGICAPESFKNRLNDLQIVLQNQDNREHDLLDSDDYYQFQGGLTVAVRSLTGKNPQTYFGDNSIRANPKVKTLQEEITKVYRARVVNPKWIEGVMRHGYKGAFEMAATIDFLFGYDVTTNCVNDYMYQGVAEAYLFDEKVQNFVRSKNPWALRDMAERLLEANQRGLWSDLTEETKDQLRHLVHEAEAVIEENMT
jgi:cobaltochelatase CobN